MIPESTKQTSSDSGAMFLTNFAYMFEAKGVQRYIFASGKLRDVVGASDLVAGLANSEGHDEIRGLIDKLGFNDKTEFSRRAGGAFCLHSPCLETLQTIRSHWRLYVMRNLPGLEFTEGFGEDSSDDQIAAMQDAFSKSSGIRSNSVAEVLPLGRPVHDYAPMTGRPHVEIKNYRSDEVALDSVTKPQRERADFLQGKMDGVALRFLRKGRLRCKRVGQVPKIWEYDVEGARQRVDAYAGLYVFPRNFDPHNYRWKAPKDQQPDDPAKDQEDEETNPLFPFRNPDKWWHGHGDENAILSYPTSIPEDRRYALVHADLSGLGELFQSFSAAREPGDNRGSAFTAAEQNLALATSIETEIIAAAKVATETILDRCGDSHGRKVIPMRPILLGGDDITFIIRADLAIDYTATLLEEIETKLAEVPLIKDGPTRLSACAGIAIVRPGTPFLSANMLAESLCKFAKSIVKKGGHDPKGYASAIAFHLQHQTAHEEYEGDIWEEATDANGHALSANPFGVGYRKGELPKSICGLCKLAKAIDQAPAGHGTLRQIQSLINEDAGQATARWRRWHEIGRDGEKADKKAVADLLSCGANSAPSGNSGVYDALVLIDIGAVVEDAA
jgi:hypothetical protein